jgi:hypothetical protein
MLLGNRAETKILPILAVFILVPFQKSLILHGAHCVHQYLAAKPCAKRYKVGFLYRRCPSRPILTCSPILIYRWRLSRNENSQEIDMDYPPDLRRASGSAATSNEQPVTKPRIQNPCLFVLISGYIRVNPRQSVSDTKFHLTSNLFVCIIYI